MAFPSTFADLQNAVTRKLRLDTSDSTIIAMVKDWLNQVYAQWFNHRHDRVGHLFEQRYWSRLLDAETRFFAVALYIVANPVRAGLVATPEAYAW